MFYTILYLVILFLYLLSIFKNKYKKIIVPLVFIILILVSGFRYYIGMDYAMYMNIFDYIKNLDFNYEVKRLEKGYYWLVNGIILVNGSQQLVFFICSLVTNMFIYKTIKKLSNNMMLSTMIYFLVGPYYSASFNLIRQVLAISIFLYAIAILKNKKRIVFIFWTLLGGLFHKSCFLLLPILFLDKLKLNNKIKILLLFFTVIFNSILPKFYEISGYGHYMLLKYEATTNFITLSFFLILVLLIEWYEKKMNIDIIDKNINFITLLLLITIFINEKTFPTANQVFVRMSSYFFFYYIILIPKLLEILKKKFGKVVIIVFFIAISILYFKTFLLQLPEYCYNLKLFY